MTRSTFSNMLNNTDKEIPTQHEAIYFSKKSVQSDCDICITTTQKIIELIAKFDDTNSSAPSSVPTTT